MDPPTPEEMAATQVPQIIAANVVVAVAATVAVGLRLMARRVKRLGLGADDITIIVALPVAWSVVISDFVAAANGLGRHMNTLTPEEFARESKAFYSAQLLWAVAIPIVKVSILLLYIRIFGVNRSFRFVSYAVGLFSILWGIMVIFVLSFACRPFEYNWNRMIEGSCINQILFYEIGTGLNVATDLVILVLPVPVIWRLQTSIAHKLQITGVFLLGSLTCAISIARWVSIFKIEATDITWSGAQASIWSAAEVCLGIVAACLMTLRPLVDLFTAKVLGLKKDKTQPLEEPYPNARSTIVLSNNKGSELSKLYDRLDSPGGYREA